VQPAQFRSASGTRSISEVNVTGHAATVDQGTTYAPWRAKGLAGDHSLLCLYCHQAGHTSRW
jgi:hypothetical protein